MLLDLLIFYQQAAVLADERIDLFSGKLCHFENDFQVDLDAFIIDDL